MATREYIKCKCGCDIIYVPATVKNPKEAICARCRETVDISGCAAILPAR